MKGCLKSFLLIKLAGARNSYAPCFSFSLFPYWMLGLCLVVYGFVF